VKRVTEAATGLTAAGGSSTDLQYYPDLLITHGWLIPWGSWIKVIGALYVLFLLIKMTYQFIKWISPKLNWGWRKIKARLEK